MAKVRNLYNTSVFYVHNINVFSMYKGFEGLVKVINDSPSQATSQK